jgi:hypothetical protein
MRKPPHIYRILRRYGQYSKTPHFQNVAFEDDVVTCVTLREGHSRSAIGKSSMFFSLSPSCLYTGPSLKDTGSQEVCHVKRNILSISLHREGSWMQDVFVSDALAELVLEAIE